jgi:hypothetical protein
MTTTPKPHIPGPCGRYRCDGTELFGLPCDSSPDVCPKYLRLSMVSRGRAYIENQAKALAGSRQADELRALLLHMDEQAANLKTLRAVCAHHNIDVDESGRMVI